MQESDMKPEAVDAQALSDLAFGCAFLGSGGGGDPHNALLELTELVKAGGAEGPEIRLISAAELADDDVVAPCGWIGAPTVSLEKLPSGKEALMGLEKLEVVLGRKVAAICPVEIGGSNGLAPFVLAARTGLPIVDCDGMGRAFPESQMVIFNICGISAGPAVLTDAKGTCVVIETPDNLMEERIGRAAAVSLGGICHLFEYIQSGRELKDHAIHGTVSLAIQLGRAVRLAKQKGDNPFEALMQVIRDCPYYGQAGVLFDGKIVDLRRDTKDGFSVGHVTIEDFAGARTMEIEFQNENLTARAEGKTFATVPDIISILDRETADTITTEQLKYGQRVKVVGASAPTALRAEKALQVLGPKAFGLEEAYRPVEQLNEWETA
jgi:DUF917 family protein